MSDEKELESGQKRSRVCLSEPCEVKYWADRFGVTSDELKHAVHKVGCVPTQVQAWLQET